MKKLFLIPLFLSPSAFSGILTFENDSLRIESSSQDKTVQRHLVLANNLLPDIKHISFEEKFLSGYDADKTLLFKLDLSSGFACAQSMHSSSFIGSPVELLGSETTAKEAIEQIKFTLSNFNPITVSFENVTNKVTQIHMQRLQQDLAIPIYPQQPTQFNFNGTIQTPLQIKLGSESNPMPPFSYSLKMSAQAAKSHATIHHVSAQLISLQSDDQESYEIADAGELSEIVDPRNNRLSVKKAYHYANHKHKQKFTQEFNGKMNRLREEKNTLLLKQRDLTEKTAVVNDVEKIKILQEKEEILALINREKKLKTLSQELALVENKKQKEQEILEAIQENDMQIQQKLELETQETNRCIKYGILSLGSQLLFKAIFYALGK